VLYFDLAIGQGKYIMELKGKRGLTKSMVLCEVAKKHGTLLQGFTVVLFKILITISPQVKTIFWEQQKKHNLKSTAITLT